MNCASKVYIYIFLFSYRAKIPPKYAGFVCSNCGGGSFFRGGGREEYLRPVEIFVTPPGPGSGWSIIDRPIH